MKLSTMTSSFLPLHQDTKKGKDIISTFPNVNEQKNSWKIDDNQLNEFNTEFLATMSFPSLFPDSIADPTSNITIGNISESENRVICNEKNTLSDLEKKTMAQGNTGLQHIPALATGPVIYCIESDFSAKGISL